MIKRKDIIFIVAVLIISIAFFLLFSYFAPYGKKVTVYIDNEKRETFNLTDTVEKTYNTKYGSNLLIIENGKAYIKTANCDKNTCVKTGKISKKGETIVCAPHRLLVVIE